MKNNNKDTGVWEFKTIEHPFLDEEHCFLDHKTKYELFNKIIKPMLSEVRTICDIGVGAGFFYKDIIKENVQISGIDIVPEYVDLSRKRGIDARICDINKEKTPFDDNSFDLVICDSILEHTFNPTSLVSECLRILKKNGTLILAVPNAMSFKMRWDYLRGRNQFWPLINNLITEIGYLKRCSIFYGYEELKKLFPNREIKPFYINENFYRDRKKPLVAIIINFLAEIIPSGRTMIAVIVKK